MNLFDLIFADLRVYRRWCGGTWYLMWDELSVTGVAGGVRIWTRDRDYLDGWEVLRIENYESKGNT